MRNIVPEIQALDQYQKLKKEEPECFRPACCPGCGKAGLWRHGHYGRKADRQNTSATLNPVSILRFFCQHCGKTCSTLPECMPSRRWYLWSIQQAALARALAGKSFSAIAKEVMLSRHTVSRWLTRLKARLRLHKDALCQRFNDLGRTHDFSGFWLACLKKIPLSQAMRICHATGVTIP